MNLDNKFHSRLCNTWGKLNHANHTKSLSSRFSIIFDEKFPALPSAIRKSSQLNCSQLHMQHSDIYGISRWITKNDDYLLGRGNSPILLGMLGQCDRSALCTWPTNTDVLPPRDKKQNYQSRSAKLIRTGRADFVLFVITSYMLNISWIWK